MALAGQEGDQGRHVMLTDEGIGEGDGISLPSKEDATACAIRGEEVKVLKGRTERFQNYGVGDLRKFCLLETHNGRCGSGDHAADGGALSAGVKATDIPKKIFRLQSIGKEGARWQRRGGSPLGYN